MGQVEKRVYKTIVAYAVIMTSLIFLFLFNTHWFTPNQEMPGVDYSLYQSQIDYWKEKAESSKSAADEALYLANSEASKRKVAEAATNRERAKHARLIDSLRKLPPVDTTVTTLFVAECDSCMEVGFLILEEKEYYQEETRLLRIALDSCGSAYMFAKNAQDLSDTANVMLNKKLVQSEAQLGKTERKLKGFKWLAATLPPAAFLLGRFL